MKFKFALWRSFGINLLIALTVFLFIESVLNISIAWWGHLFNLPKALNSIGDSFKSLPSFLPTIFVGAFAYTWAVHIFERNNWASEETVSIKLYALKNTEIGEELVTVDSTKRLAPSKRKSFNKDGYVFSKWKEDIPGERLSEQYNQSWFNEHDFIKSKLSAYTLPKHKMAFNWDYSEDRNASIFFESLELLCVSIHNTGRMDSFVEPPVLYLENSETEYLPVKPVYVSNETSEERENRFSLLTPGARIKYFYSIHEIVNQIENGKAMSPQHQDMVLNKQKRLNFFSDGRYKIKFKFKGSKPEGTNKLHPTETYLSGKYHIVFIPRFLEQEKDNVLKRFQNPILNPEFDKRWHEDYVLQRFVIQELFLAISLTNTTCDLKHLLKLTLIYQKLINFSIRDKSKDEVFESLSRWRPDTKMSATLGFFIEDKETKLATNEAVSIALKRLRDKLLLNSILEEKP